MPPAPPAEPLEGSVPAGADRVLVRFQRPAFPPSEAIERSFAVARERRWFSNRGACERELAERLSSRTGAVCLPVSSGTTGLLLAARALGTRTRGTVAVVPSFTFPATVQSLVWAGFEPVFVDVDPDAFHLDPEALAESIEEWGGRLGLVLACSAFGTPPPPATREAWASLCSDAGVPLLVDSAAGFGAVCADGVPIGCQGDVEVVSFHITKPFGIGEGGGVFTRNHELAAEMAALANFSFDAHRQARSLYGLNAKLDELHAAVGLAVLDDFDDVLRRRREASTHLLSLLDNSLVPQRGHELGTRQFVPVVAQDSAHRQRIMRAATGVVELRTYYDPLHLMPAFQGLPRLGALSVTEELGRRIISLPMANDFTNEESAVVAAVCNEAATR